MMFKGIVLKGSLVKLEKYIDEEKVSECGIDSQESQALWGDQQPLRAEYEAWVSNGGNPEYEMMEEIEGL